MMEFIDNLTQVLVSTLGGIFSGILYLKSRAQAYFLLTCFYGCFMLAGLYWLLYTVLISDAPPIFYVAEIGWVAGYLFLCLLQDSLSDPRERAFRCRAMWLAPLVIIPLTLYFITISYVIYTLLVGCIMFVLFWRALRGFAYWRNQTGRGRKKRFFHLAVLCFVILEHGLWISSYPWISDTWTNPYLLDRLCPGRFASFPAARSEKGGGGMTYIENIFVCIVAPLAVAALCMGRSYLRIFLFAFAGMGACLLSAYINAFVAALYQATAFQTTAEIAPVVEEVMKLLPLLFYLLVFEPESRYIKSAALTVAAGFATFENICYLIQNGAEDLRFLLVRGFGAGAMHIVCGAFIACGLTYVWQRGWLKAAGTCGLLGAAVAFHGLYNLLIAYGGRVQYIAYAMPLVTLALGFSAGHLLSRLTQGQKN